MSPKKTIVSDTLAVLETLSDPGGRHREDIPDPLLLARAQQPCGHLTAEPPQPDGGARADSPTSRRTFRPAEDEARSRRDEARAGPASDLGSTC